MSVITEIKQLLGMEVKLSQMKLENGTVIEAEEFAPEFGVFIVNEEERIPMPIGEYVLEDGNILKVDVEGIIEAIEAPQEEQPQNEEPTPSPAEAEMEVEQSAEVAAPKRIVESITKEMFFSAIDELKKEIEALKLASQKDLTDDDLMSEEVKENLSEVKPLKHSPEMEAPKVQKFASNRPMTTADRVMAKIFNN